MVLQVIAVTRPLTIHLVYFALAKLVRTKQNRANANLNTCGCLNSLSASLTPSSLLMSQCTPVTEARYPSARSWTACRPQVVRRRSSLRKTWRYNEKENACKNACPQSCMLFCLLRESFRHFTFFFFSRLYVLFCASSGFLGAGSRAMLILRVQLIL